MPRFDLLNEYSSVYVPQPASVPRKPSSRPTSGRHRLFSIAAIAVVLTGATMLML